MAIIDQARQVDSDEATPARWPFSITVALPAFNEAHGIADVIQSVHEICPEAEILVIADGSTDGTPEVAERAGARVVCHPYNKGNGAAIKTAIREATGDVLVIIDADGQHDPADIPRLLDYMQSYDMAVGVRSRASHASRTRGLGNWLLDRFASYVAGMDLDDLTSGFRAMRRSVVLEFVHLLPNRYSWPTTSMLSFAKAGYSIKFVPISARLRAGGKSGQKLLQNGVKFVMIILRIVMLFNPLRVMGPIGLFLFLLSILGYLLSVLSGDRVLHLPGSTVMFFVGAVVVWMFGLLAEQIVALGLGRRDR
jgi:glycosyltransferase involved in cell wall biosynthesis